MLRESGLIHFGTGELTGDMSRSRFVKLIQISVTRPERNGGKQKAGRISQLAFAKLILINSTFYHVTLRLPVSIIPN